ncbi:hypothetical protein DSM106972_096060 [Dulcicalothrix desertica PCC 7102]|uniref:Uncharacterized protein n=1 Tax=Dulcicalothrix desertica PCC 7102 TaxID=232991 RepID=A0A3S1BXV9_9CYAN|nr:beta-Ig-H3/fasciclin [Dulcicalothrix desertica]RUS93457.1 hypothetical protein DSM106972_096060 [Dulcicalothrix desertica PCC 7102]TWH39685.1 hypothetical protein CAL7102_08938 [Dulcicalothrix desertica PCC 7102]
MNGKLLFLASVFGLNMLMGACQPATDSGTTTPADGTTVPPAGTGTTVPPAGTTTISPTPR